MEIIDYYREIQFEASRDAYKSTCHYLRVENGAPRPHGSGVFVQVGMEKFLFTAAHVTDEVESDIYVGTGEHDMLRLGGDLTGNKASGHRNDDRIDIAIIKLDQETVRKLGDQYDFLSSAEIGVNHEFKHLAMYQSVGFPATMSKFNRYKNELRSRPFIFTTMPAEAKVYEELNCESFSNVIVHYDKKRVKDYSTNKIQTGPDPLGISGSGLWYIPSQLKTKAEKVNKKLVAIMTEWPKENRKFWIGTRIDLFTEIIRQKYEVDIEQSQVVKVSI